MSRVLSEPKRTADAAGLPGNAPPTKVIKAGVQPTQFRTPAVASTSRLSQKNKKYSTFQGNQFLSNSDEVMYLH